MHERGFDAIETTSGDFIIVGERAEDYLYEHFKGVAMKLNSTGELIDELEVGDSIQNYRFTLINKLYGNENRFLLIGSMDSISVTDSFARLILYTCNDSLDILSQKRILSMQNHTIYAWKDDIVNDSILYILVEDHNLNFTPANQQLGIVKINMPYDSLNVYFTGGNTTTRIAQDVLYLKSKNILNIFYFGSLLDLSGATRIIQLTDSLTVLGSKICNVDLISTFCATYFSDSTYLLTGTGKSEFNYGYENHILSYLMNDQDDTLHRLEYLNNPDTILYAGFGTNTIINDGSIFITGIYNVEDPWGIPWLTTPTWIQITKTDLDMNIISQYFYGGDAEYLPYTIIPTEDGGALVTGLVWEYNIPNNFQHDIFALKVNSEGILTSFQEHSAKKACEVIVYPNPGSEHLGIRSSCQIFGSKFTMYDLTGKVLFESEIEDSQIEINTSDLPNGTYIWQVVNTNRMIDSGKWIKEFSNY